MKKLLTIAACSAAFVAMADFPSPMPNNTLKLAIKQAVAEAKAYTDAKVAGGSGAQSNEVAAIRQDIATINTKIAALPSADDVAAVAETAGEAKGAATANTESISALTTTVAGKLDASTAASTYQPKGDYLESESDPSVPAWAKEESKPKYDASEITYQNGFIAAYLAELNGKIPSVYPWALSATKPSYGADEITYGNGFIGPFLTELSTTVGTKANADEVYTKDAADRKFLTHHQDLSDYPKKSEVYSVARIDEIVTDIEANLSTKAGRSYAYSKAETDTKLGAIDAKLREALARIKVLEKTTTPTEGVTGVVAASGQPVNVNDASTDVVMGGTVDTGTVSLTAKSIDIDNLSASPQYGTGAGVTMDSPKIDVTDSTFTGASKQSSNLVEVHNTDTMTIKGTTFSGQTYNTVMTGQRTTDYLKELTIEDCNFAEDCAHVNVWFAGFKDDAVLNIKNCTFKTCEQFLCVSDFSGADKKLTINLENVEILNYEKGTAETPDAYEGIMLFDDRICADDATFVATAPFKNVTLNLKNCTAGGVALTADTFKMGTGAPGQMFYLYCAKARKVYTFDATTKALWPKVVVNDVVVNDPAN